MHFVLQPTPCNGTLKEVVKMAKYQITCWNWNLVPSSKKISGREKFCAKKRKQKRRASQPLLMETVQRRWGLNDWIDEFQSTIDWILKETKQMSWYCRWQPEIRLILTSWGEGSLSTIIYWVLAPCQVRFLAGNFEPSTVCHVKLQGCFPGLVWGNFMEYQYGFIKSGCSPITLGQR